MNLSKQRFLISILVLCISLVICLFLSPHSLSALGRDSVIAIIQGSFPSIVNIKAENAQLFKGSNYAFKDKDSGRIAVTKGVRTAKYTRVGAGVVIDQSGIIVTNAHTILQAARVTVASHDRTEHVAKVIRVIPNEDIAFIQIEQSADLIPMPFSDSDAVKLRDDVYTVGASEFLKGTIVRGKVTGIGKKAKHKKQGNILIDLIQTSFEVYKGDSGGPLLDREGNLLGLMVAARSNKPHTSYAIPSNKIKKFYQDYLKKLNSNAK